jgi:hypothetical protein
MALCHTVARKAAREGDVIVEISGKGGRTKTKYQPKAYANALAQLPKGARAGLSVTGVRNKVLPQSYHTGVGVPGAPGYRRDQIYKELPSTSREGWKIGKSRWGLRHRARLPTATKHEFGRSDFAGPVVLGKTFIQYRNNLKGAPLMPAPLQRSLFGAGWRGRGCKVLRGAVGKRLLAWATEDDQ